MKQLSLKLCISVLCWSIQSHVFSQTAPCPATPIPDLVGDWEKATFGKIVADSAAIAATARFRPDLPSLDPFKTLASDEFIAWEDKEIMVILDNKGGYNFLVMPKANDINFIVDASPDLCRKLATVAAATSDAVRWAMPAPCQSAVAISISAAGGLMVRRLHIHINPQHRINNFDQNAYNSRVKEHLKKKLK